jgi:hypothetical protein
LFAFATSFSAHNGSRLGRPAHWLEPARAIVEVDVVHPALFD